jgi:YebC/PmpR family DNA-binding regulatory protein
MSGHSHWSTIKRKKGAADAKKGAVFTRSAREIALAARLGGGDPGMNVSLYLAIERARAVNMPKDSIERAISRGTGDDKAGIELEEIVYEGYAGHGVAVMIECVTENRNRTVAEIRHILSRAGGNLADGVGWQFDRKAYFSIPEEGQVFDKIFELAVEAGADDIQQEEGYIEIIADADAFKSISEALKAAKIKPEEAKLRYFPKQEIELPKDQALSVMRLIESLEESDDIQNVYSNLNVPDEVWAELEKE